MEEATDAKPPAKRARVDDAGTSTATTTTITTEDPHLPKTLAEAHINITAASLHPQIAPIVTKLGKTHLLLLCKREQKQKAVQRLIDDEQLIPRSARFQFTLSAPKRTEASLEYTTLQEKAKAIVTQCGLDLKKVIIQAAKLEIITLDNDIKIDLVRSIRLITQAFLIVNNDSTNCDNKAHQLASLHIASLSKNAKMDINEFCDVYKNTHSLESFPVRIPRETIEIDHSDSMFATQIARTTTETDQTNHDLDIIKQTIESVFITAWAKYTEQQKKNKIALELKKLSASFFTEQATEQSVIEVDQEPAADKIELKALIRQEAKAETKSLEQKINELTKQIADLAEAARSKNTNTGGRQHGAPSNERNPPRVRWSQQPYDRNSNNNNDRSSSNNNDEHNSSNHTGPSQPVTLGRPSTSRTPSNTNHRDENNYYGPSTTVRASANAPADDNSNDSAHENRNSRMSSGQQRSTMRNSQYRGRQNKPSNTFNKP
jgi:hypothetical protein